MVNSPRASVKGDSPLATSPALPPELQTNPINRIAKSIKNESNDENINIDESFAQSGKIISESGPSKSKQSIAKKNRTTKRRKQMYCLCEGEDDGTPMIRCEGPCKNWYHFRCVSLSEAEAEEIAFYICPPCHEKTGLFTVRDWEGPDALEEVPVGAAWPGESNGSQSPQAQEKKPKEVYKEEEFFSSEDKDDGSEDEYVAESSKKRVIKGKRSARRATVSSESSDSEVSDTASKSTARRSAPNKGPVKIGVSTSTNKRKGSTAKSPPAKKTKIAEGPKTAQSDPVRKYCLGKLQEVILAIFMEFANDILPENAESTTDSQDVLSVKKEFLTEEESKATTDKAAAYVSELEENLYNKYSEPDKDGKPSAGGKYKEHFRMLTFNLCKSDRVSLRKGISTGRISPAQLSVMSSTDLASEHLKHEIELAEKEALEHSILQKIVAPRTKITHKGLESIEDINGNVQQPDRQREEQEQRMERERLARVRSMSMTRDRASPMLSESPTTISASWGQPLHSPLTPLPRGIEPSNVLSPTIISSSQSTFSPPSEIMAPPDTALALTDLINIDDDTPQDDTSVSLKVVDPNEFSSSKQSSSKPDLPTQTITPSGPSPFALSLPSIPAVNPVTKEELAPEEKSKVETELTNQNSAALENMDDDAMDMDIEGEQSEDPDFDMFLDPDKGKVQDFSVVSNPVKPLTLDTLPRIWSGAIVMPLDSLIPLAPSVFATQIGGRIIDDAPHLWKQLFPTAEVRIDGRVPVDKSSQYLLTNRLNFSKELIAVCFSAQTASDPSIYNELINYLISKGRHALVFPWGTHPSPDAPGRELYLVPLLHEHPIPEFVEMLDNLRLPVKRDTNLLLGVFVLNKGKLNSPPTASNPLQTTGNISLSHVGPINSSLPVNVALPTNIDPSTLAAEVASLTPDQIALMLRHLGQNMSTPQSALPVSTSASSISVPYSSSSRPLYPLPQRSPQSPLASSYPPQPYIGGSHNDSYGRSELDREARSSYDGRGDRGRGQHRGRGRSNGRDNDRSRFRNLETRVQDSGWGGRGRGGPPRGSPKG